jgi:hypothetical protein
VKLRNLGPIVALALALLPRPAEAQGDFIKDKVQELIEKSGIYVSMSTRTAIDSDVEMGRTLGIGYGTAGNKNTGWKFPFSFSGFSGNLETTDDVRFGRIKSRQLMSGVGYQWVHGKMVYGTQLGLGFAFNKVTLDPGVALAFGVPEPVSVDVSNSFVVRPKVQAEYFLHHKVSLRTQLAYTYTDPDVTVNSATQSFGREWNPHHVQLNFAVGVFPFRKK